MSKLPQVLATVAVAVLGFAAQAASAQEATYEYPDAIGAGKSRTEIQAELAQAKRDGSMRVWSTSYNHMTAAKSVRTRADVRAEVLNADRAALAAIHGEDGGSFALSRPLARPAGTVLAGR